MQQNLGSLPSQRSNDLLKSILNSSNPKELLNSLISNNPQMKSLVQAMQSSGMTPKDYFYTFAKQKGVDPDQFLSSIKN